MGTEFIKQVSDVRKEFRTFALEHKKTCVFTAFVVFASWGALTFRTDIGVDTEIMITGSQGMLQSWYGLGRFGLVFTKKLLGTDKLSQTVIMMASMFLIGMICMTVNFAVSQWSKGDKRYEVFYPVFSAVYGTCPCLAEQFYFQMQALEVIWGIYLSVLAVYSASRYVYEKESRGWLLFSLICGVWAVGTYQAMAAVFIALSAFSFLLAYQNEQTDEESKAESWFRKGVWFAAVFLVILAVHGALAHLIRSVTNTNGEYLNTLVFWGRDGLKVCLHRVLTDIQRIYLGQPPFFSPLTLVILILAAGLFWVRGWKTNQKERVFFLFAGAVFVSSPVLMGILTGTFQGIRVQLAYPFVLSVSAGVLATIKPEGRGQKLLPFAAVSLAVVVAWNQWMSSERLLDTMHRASIQDEERCKAIYQEAERVAAISGGTHVRDMTLVFVGKRPMDTNVSTLKGDMIGVSVFEWDELGPTGVSGRVSTLFYVYGLMHQKATPEQYLASVIRAEYMPSWPDQGSVVREEERIIIKLSDPHLEVYERLHQK